MFNRDITIILLKLTNCLFKTISFWHRPLRSIRSTKVEPLGGVRGSYFLARLIRITMKTNLRVHTLRDVFRRFIKYKRKKSSLLKKL